MSSFQQGGQRQALTLLMAAITKPRTSYPPDDMRNPGPKYGKKVLGIIREIAASSETCTLMITRRYESTRRAGYRTIMMHEGKIVLDIKGTERSAMTVEKVIRGI